MLSSGVRNLFKIVGGWGLCIAVTAGIAMNFDEIRTRTGLKLEAADFGIAKVAEEPESQVREIIRYVERPAEEKDETPDARRRSSRPREQAPLFTTSARLQRGSNGHFHADASINGRTIGVLVDTGATLVALSYEDAQAAGVHVRSSDFNLWSETANGRARFARVTLDEVRIGNVVVRNVAAAVSEPGRLSNTLLGMSFLGKLRMEMQGNTLLLEQY